MEKARVNVVVFLAALAVLAGAASFAARSSKGQSQDPKSAPLVKPTVLVSESNNPGKNTSSAFETAAGKNSVLENELIWTFGGKLQTGWYLYHSLIVQLLKTRSDASATDFAADLALWQKQTGLNAEGVLDEESLMAMVSQWQGSRLKDRTPAQTEQLLTAPSSDFYDPERLAELRQVERTTYAAYKAMVAAAVADPTLKLAHTELGDLAPAEKYFKIVSAFRSREYQEKLRRESPNAGSAGLAVNSPHFTGRALDIYVGGDPVDTKDSNRAIQVKTAVYQWLVRNAERFGFRPYFYEPWHWEYVR